MNRNQKIALGCGGAGCLGLIVVIVAGALIYFWQARSTTSTANRNSNYNVNSDSTSPANANADADESSGTSTDSSSGTSSSMSDDAKHRLYHAATATKDTETMVRVWKKLGLTDADGTPNEKYRQFAQNHIAWLFRNTDFMQEVNTEEKARAYVDAHIND